MGKVKCKRFRDNVHNYITIPEPIVKNVIDAEFFQRLRWVEQTGMRVLYPSSRHDRFVHSMGVYHLGKIAFKHFRNNAIEVLERYSREDDSAFLPEDAWWEKKELLFSLACLLHDCAHAPFSHTLEYVYEVIKHKSESGEPTDGLINEVLAEKEGASCSYGENLSNLSELDWQVVNKYGLQNRTFAKDYFQSDGVTTKTCGKPHEKLSALMLKASEAKESIKKTYEDIIGGDIEDADYEFMARAIIGCKYNARVEDNACHNDREKELCNCLIMLLNSDIGFDVDGMDYTVRDTKNSGYDNVAVDYERILSSLVLVKYDEKHVLGFRHGCTGVLQSYLNARNNLYKEIYSHHTVKFLSDFLRPELLKLSARWLCCKLNNNNNGSEDCLGQTCGCLTQLGCRVNKGEHISDHDQTDSIQASVLGLKSFYTKDPDIVSGAENRVDEKDFTFYRSTDADIDNLFKQVYQDSKNDCSDGAKIVNYYMKMYFCRKFARPIWKVPEELEYLLGDKKLLFLEGQNNKTLASCLVNEASVARNSTNMAERWKDSELLKEFENNSIKNPVCIKYENNVKALKRDKILILMDDKGSTVKLSELCWSGDNTGQDSGSVKHGGSPLFYLFGEINKEDSKGEPRNSLNKEETIELFKDLRKYYEPDDGGASS